MKKLCRKLTLAVSVMMFCSSCSAMRIALERQPQIMTGTWRIRELGSHEKEIVFIGSDPLKNAERSRYADDPGKAEEPAPVRSDALKN